MTTTTLLIGTIEHNETAERIAICFDTQACKLVSVDIQGLVEDCAHKVATTDQAHADFLLLWGPEGVSPWYSVAYAGWVEYLNQCDNDDVFVVQAAARVTGLDLGFAQALYYGDNDLYGYFKIEDAQAAATQGIVWVTRREGYAYGPRVLAATKSEEGLWQPA